MDDQGSSTKDFVPNVGRGHEIASKRNVKELSDDARDELALLYDQLLTFKHDCLNPLRSIQDNAIFLLRHRVKLTDDKIEAKLNDIVEDCEVLLQEIRNLSDSSSRAVPALRIETVPVRRILVQTKGRLEAMLRRRRVDGNRIEYDTDRFEIAYVQVDTMRIIDIFAKFCDSALRLNADGFRMRITAQETVQTCVIHARAWVPDVITGRNGVDASRSRDLVKQMGGDLTFTRSANTAELKLTLRKATRGEHDSVRG